MHSSGGAVMSRLVKSRGKSQRSGGTGSPRKRGRAASPGDEPKDLDAYLNDLAENDALIRLPEDARGRVPDLEPSRPRTERLDSKHSVKQKTPSPKKRQKVVMDLDVDDDDATETESESEEDEEEESSNTETETDADTERDEAHESLKRDADDKEMSSTLRNPDTRYLKLTAALDPRELPFKRNPQFEKELHNVKGMKEPKTRAENAAIIEQSLAAAEEFAPQLYVATSMIPHAGLGVFCRTDIDVGDIVDEYKGQLLTEQDLETLYGEFAAPYALQCVKQGDKIDDGKGKAETNISIDAALLDPNNLAKTFSLARFINDPTAQRRIKEFEELRREQLRNKEKAKGIKGAKPNRGPRIKHSHNFHKRSAGSGKSGQLLPEHEKGRPPKGKRSGLDVLDSRAAMKHNAKQRKTANCDKRKSGEGLQPNVTFVNIGFRLFVQAIRAIPANTELLVDYGNDYWYDKDNLSLRDEETLLDAAVAHYVLYDWENPKTSEKNERVMRYGALQKLLGWSQFRLDQTRRALQARRLISAVHAYEEVGLCPNGVNKKLQAERCNRTVVRHIECNAKNGKPCNAIRLNIPLWRNINNPPKSKGVRARSNTASKETVIITRRIRMLQMRKWFDAVYLGKLDPRSQPDPGTMDPCSDDSKSSD